MNTTATARLSAPQADRPPQPGPFFRAPRGQTLVAAAGVLVCAAAFATTLSGSSAAFPGLVGVVRTLAIGVPIGVGIFTWKRHPDYPVGRLLVAAGFAWSLTTLAESSNEVLYSLGRVFVMLVEPTLLFVLLAFPFARLQGRAALGLVLAATIVVLTLYLPTALMVHQYPVPTPYASCATECPDNAFALTSHQPAVVDSVVLPLREALTSMLFLGAVLVLGLRARLASRAARRVVVPILAAASARLFILPVYLVARRASPDSAALDILGWVFLLSLPTIALAFLVGMVRGKLLLTGALERVTAGLPATPEGRRVRNGLPEDLGERPLEPLPPAASGSRSAAARLAALLNDPGLSGYPGLLEATGPVVRLALDNERMASELQASLRELRASRARIQASADAVRRGIERDLHDGAQQHLVTLQMRLELALDLLDTNRDKSLGLLREVGRDAEEALDGIRSLAHGVYPSILADRGVAEALRSAARHSPRPVKVQVSHVERYPHEVEAAVYFCCLEAIQNATKHGGKDATITLSLSGGPELRFEVHDDGAGFDAGDLPPSSGLTNMRDRIEAAGGILTITSAPGAGTTVRGLVASC